MLPRCGSTLQSLDYVVNVLLEIARFLLSDCVIGCRMLSTNYIQGGPLKNKPLPNYQKIVLNRINACQ